MLIDDQENILIEGRRLLESAFDTYNPERLEQFYDWLGQHARITMLEVRRTFDPLFLSSNKYRALKLYDYTMERPLVIRSQPPQMSEFSGNVITGVILISSMILVALVGYAVVIAFLKHQ